MYGVGQVPAVPSVVTPASSGVVIQLPNGYGLTGGNLLIYGGEALLILLAIFMPSGGLKDALGLAAAAGAVGLVVIFIGAGQVH